MKIAQDESLHEHVNEILSKQGLSRKELIEGISFFDSILSDFISNFNGKEISESLKGKNIKNVIVEDCCIDLGYDKKNSSSLEIILEELSSSGTKRKKLIPNKGVEEVDELAIKLTTNAYLSNFNGAYTGLILKANDLRDLREIFVIEHLSENLGIKEFGDRNIKEITDYLLNLFKLKGEYLKTSNTLKDNLVQLKKIVDVDKSSIERYNTYLSSLLTPGFSRLKNIKDENERVLARECIEDYELFLEELDSTRRRIIEVLGKKLDGYASNLDSATYDLISELNELYKLMKINMEEEISSLLNNKIKKELTKVSGYILNLEGKLEKFSKSKIIRFGILNPNSVYKMINLKRSIATERHKNDKIIESGKKVGGVSKECIDLYNANIKGLNDLSQSRENLLEREGDIISRFKRRVKIAFATSLVLLGAYIGKGIYDSELEEIKEKRNNLYNEAEQLYENGNFEVAYGISDKVMKEVDSSLIFRDEGMAVKAFNLKQDSKIQAELIKGHRLEEYKQEMLEIENEFENAFANDDYDKSDKLREDLNEFCNTIKKTIKEYSF